jgi:hypothetical protein
VALYYRADVANGSVCSRTTGTQSYYRPNTRLTFSGTVAQLFALPDPVGKENDLATMESAHPADLFEIYPNPFDGTLLRGKISTPTDRIAVKVFDLTGRLLLHQTAAVANGEFSFSFEPRLHTGVYLINGAVDKQSFTRRIIVE